MRTGTARVSIYCYSISLFMEMCDLTPFLISSILDQLTPQPVDTILMEDVIMLFGIFAVVIIEADRKFRVVF